MTQAFNLALFANQLNSSGQLNVDTGIYNTVNIANGGTNLSATPTNGQLLIGDGTGYTLATLTASTGIGITNAAGSITITNTQPNAVVDIQTFNPGGGTIWTKPTTGQTMCRIQMWGGGGGGNRSGDSLTAAGGGGAYNEIVVPLSYMNSTATITVGAAGVGRTGSAGAGTAGGASSVTIPNMPTGSLTLFAYGGGAGGAGTSRGTPGGGGGTRSGGGTGTTGFGYSTVDYGSMGDGTMWGGASGAGASCGPGPGYYALWGGAGGTAGTGAVIKSLFGGAGGNRTTAGATPAGGGGSAAAANVDGTNGGAGRVIITSW